MMRSQKTCLFIGTGIVYNEECQDYKNCGRQVLVKKNSLLGALFLCNKKLREPSSDEKEASLQGGASWDLSVIAVSEQVGFLCLLIILHIGRE